MGWVASDYHLELQLMLITFHFVLDRGVHLPHSDFRNVYLVRSCLDGTSTTCAKSGAPLQSSAVTRIQPDLIQGMHCDSIVTILGHAFCPDK